MPKILIIEDDPLIQRMYAKIFSFHHFTVITADDGEAGIACALAELPDIILLDVMMPKLNGLDVLDRLKAHHQVNHIPIIMLSNLAGGPDMEIAVQKGAVQYVVKSEHDPKEVVDIVEQHLGL